MSQKMTSHRDTAQLVSQREKGTLDSTPNLVYGVQILLTGNIQRCF